MLYSVHSCSFGRFFSRECGLREGGMTATSPVFKNILDLYGGGGGWVSEIVFLSADLILGETDEDA